MYIFPKRFFSVVIGYYIIVFKKNRYVEKSFKQRSNGNPRIRTLVRIVLDTKSNILISFSFLFLFFLFYYYLFSLHAHNVGIQAHLPIVRSYMYTNKYNKAI